jgi:hypothetical protein
MRRFLVVLAVMVAVFTGVALQTLKADDQFALSVLVAALGGFTATTLILFIWKD